MFLGDSRNELNLVMSVGLLYIPEWKNTYLFVVLDVCIKLGNSSKHWKGLLFEEIYLRIWALGRIPSKNIRIQIWL